MEVQLWLKNGTNQGQCLIERIKYVHTVQKSVIVVNRFYTFVVYVIQCSELSLLIRMLMVTVVTALCVHVCVLFVSTCGVFNFVPFKYTGLYFFHSNLQHNQLESIEHGAFQHLTNLHTL